MEQWCISISTFLGMMNLVCQGCRLQAVQQQQTLRPEDNLYCRATWGSELHVHYLHHSIRYKVSRSVSPSILAAHFQTGCNPPCAPLPSPATSRLALDGT